MSDDIYRQQILDHYRHPRNFGQLKKPTHAAGHANVSCGDSLQFQAVVAKGKITDVAFTGQGCAVSMAAASMISDTVKGMPLTKIAKLSLPDVEKLLQIPLSGGRIRCAMLGLETVQKLQPFKN